MTDPQLAVRTAGAWARLTVLALCILALAQAMRAQNLKPVPSPKVVPSPKAVQWFDAASLSQKLGSRPWYQFLNPGSLRCGMYRLAKGGVDGQSPHAMDEVYHVTSGKASLEAGGSTKPVGPGSIVYVAAGVPHRFVDIEQELTVLVLFSEYRRPTGGMAAGPRPTTQTPYPESSQRGSARIFYWFGPKSAGQCNIDYGQPLWLPRYEQFLTQPSGKRWRLGQNFWTSLDTNMELTVGGVTVPIGQHYLLLENHAEHGLRLLALDPDTVRRRRLDSYEANKTSGGIAIPLTHQRQPRRSAQRLRFELTVDRSEPDAHRGELVLRLGPHRLSAALVMHPRED